MCFYALQSKSLQGLAKMALKKKIKGVHVVLVTYSIYAYVFNSFTLKRKRKKNPVSTWVRIFLLRA